MISLPPNLPPFTWALDRFMFTPLAHENQPFKWRCPGCGSIYHEGNRCSCGGVKQDLSEVPANLREQFVHGRDIEDVEWELIVEPPKQLPEGNKL